MVLAADVLEAYEHARDLVLHECGLSDRDVALLVAATAAARSDSYCALAWGSRLLPARMSRLPRRPWRARTSASTTGEAHW